MSAERPERVALVRDTKRAGGADPAEGWFSLPIEEARDQIARGIFEEAGWEYAEAVLVPPGEGEL